VDEEKFAGFADWLKDYLLKQDAEWQEQEAENKKEYELIMAKHRAKERAKRRRKRAAKAVLAKDETRKAPKKAPRKKL
jgi:hypothetical protein